MSGSCFAKRFHVIYSFGGILIDRLSQFQWTVAENGYCFLELEALKGAPKDSYLTASIPFGRSYAGSRYTPPSGLFKDFAALSPQPDRIVEFANRWGMLTAGDWIKLENQKLGLGETLDSWKSHIADLSLAVQIWEMVKSSDLSGLSRFIKWKDSSAVMFERPADNPSEPGPLGTVPWLPGVLLPTTLDFQEVRWIAARETNPALLETFRVGDLIAPAWHQLQHFINERLEGKVSARLLWNSRHSRLSMHQVPSDLISALWLQLARAIEGDRKYLQCDECRNWFEVSSPDGGRKDKRFCGTACRARYWRKSKEGK